MNQYNLFTLPLNVQYVSLQPILYIFPFLSNGGNFLKIKIKLKLMQLVLCLDHYNCAIWYFLNCAPQNVSKCTC